MTVKRIHVCSLTDDLSETHCVESISEFQVRTSRVVLTRLETIKYKEDLCQNVTYLLGECPDK